MYQFNIEFEYDADKSEANWLKHGVSLEEAKLLWIGSGAELPSSYPNETRWLRVGTIADKIFTCIFTYREKKVRMISLRCSREDEVNYYYREMSKNEKEKT